MGIIDSFKDVFKVADTVNNLDLYKKLSELQNAVFALEEENRELRDELRHRDEQKDVAGRLRTRDNAYYLDDGKILDGPYCMTCWDADRKLIRERSGATPGTHFCAFCRDKRKGR
jgi:hypothetical protein